MAIITVIISSKAVITNLATMVIVSDILISIILTITTASRQ